MGAIEPMVLPTGSKLKELVVSITRPPCKSDAPATSMILPMVHVGAYITPAGVFALCSHLERIAAVGSNCHIWLVEATLTLNPPSMYSLLLCTANPPGTIVPVLLPGQLSPLSRT